MACDTYADSYMLTLVKKYNELRSRSNLFGTEPQLASREEKRFLKRLVFAGSLFHIYVKTSDVEQPNLHSLIAVTLKYNS